MRYYAALNKAKAVYVTNTSKNKNGLNAPITPWMAPTPAQQMVLLRNRAKLPSPPRSGREACETAGSEKLFISDKPRAIPSKTHQPTHQARGHAFIKPTRRTDDDDDDTRTAPEGPELDKLIMKHLTSIAAPTHLVPPVGGDCPRTSSPAGAACVRAVG